MCKQTMADYYLLRTKWRDEAKKITSGNASHERKARAITLMDCADELENLLKNRTNQNEKIPVDRIVIGLDD